MISPILASSSTRAIFHVPYGLRIMGTNFVELKFCIFAETSLFKGFNFHGFVTGVITMPFSRLVVQWYLWINEQVMAKENNTWSSFLVVSGWTNVTNKRHNT